MSEVRKPAKFLVTKSGYLAVRVDLNVPLSALWMLEQARDFVKANLYQMQQRHQAEEQKTKIEIAKANNKSFVENL